MCLPSADALAAHRPVADVATSGIVVLMRTSSPLYRVVILVALSSIATSPAWSEINKPSLIRCKGVTITGCSGAGDGICISDTYRDRFPVTFDLKANRYRSERGSGRIEEQRETSDGGHTIYVSSPPASGEFVFAEDWQSAYANSSFRYTCEILKRYFR